MSINTKRDGAKVKYVIRLGASEASIEDVATGARYDLQGATRDDLTKVAENIAREVGIN